MDLQALSALMAPPSLDGIQKLLCIQPHADDNEIGMGGMIAALTARGCRVDYLTVTDGSLGNLGLTEGNIVRVRAAEAKAAGSHLGASEFHFLNIPDCGAGDIYAIAGQIAEILRSGQYDAVAAPDPWCPYEAHRDHVNVGFAAAHAAINCALPHYPRGTLTHPTELKAVLFYFTAKPNTTMDVTDQFERKMEAVALHRSQITPQLLELYTGYFAWRGMQMSGDRRIFEGVKALTPLQMHCTPEGAGI